MFVFDKCFLCDFKWTKCTTSILFRHLILIFTLIYRVLMYNKIVCSNHRLRYDNYYCTKREISMKYSVLSLSLSRLPLSYLYFWLKKGYAWKDRCGIWMAPYYIPSDENSGPDTPGPRQLSFLRQDNKTVTKWRKWIKIIKLSKAIHYEPFTWELLQFGKTRLMIKKKHKCACRIMRWLTLLFMDPSRYHFWRTATFATKLPFLTWHVTGVPWEKLSCW